MTTLAMTGDGVSQRSIRNGPPREGRPYGEWSADFDRENSCRNEGQSEGSESGEHPIGVEIQRRQLSFSVRRFIQQGEMRKVFLDRSSVCREHSNDRIDPSFPLPNFGRIVRRTGLFLLAITERFVKFS